MDRVKTYERMVERDRSREHPLFDKDAASLCPTARYVGGTSRWLCECSEPKECDGVKLASIRFDEDLAGQ